MPLSINCPDLMPKPGATLKVTGTTSSCEGTSAQVSCNGAAVPFTWSCTGGSFTISVTVPPCSPPPAANVMIFTVRRGSETETCSVAIDC